jgi:hypothetical protein
MWRNQNYLIKIRNDNAKIAIALRQYGFPLLTDSILLPPMLVENTPLENQAQPSTISDPINILHLWLDDTDASSPTHDACARFAVRMSARDIQDALLAEAALQREDPSHLLPNTDPSSLPVLRGYDDDISLVSDLTRLSASPHRPTPTRQPRGGSPVADSRGRGTTTLRCRRRRTCAPPPLPPPPPPDPEPRRDSLAPAVPRQRPASACAAEASGRGGAALRLGASAARGALRPKSAGDWRGTATASGCTAAATAGRPAVAVQPPPWDSSLAGAPPAGAPLHWQPPPAAVRAIHRCGRAAPPPRPRPPPCADEVAAPRPASAPPGGPDRAPPAPLRDLFFAAAAPLCLAAATAGPGGRYYANSGRVEFGPDLPACVRALRGLGIGPDRLPPAAAAALYARARAAGAAGGGRAGPGAGGGGGGPGNVLTFGPFCDFMEAAAERLHTPLARLLAGRRPAGGLAIEAGGGRAAALG